MSRSIHTYHVLPHDLPSPVVPWLPWPLCPPGPSRSDSHQCVLLGEQSVSTAR